LIFWKIPNPLHNSKFILWHSSHWLCRESRLIPGVPRSRMPRVYFCAPGFCTKYIILIDYITLAAVGIKLQLLCPRFSGVGGYYIILYRTVTRLTWHTATVGTDFQQWGVYMISRYRFVMLSYIILDTFIWIVLIFQN